MTINASGTPTPHSTKLATRVPSAYCGCGNTLATIAPEAAATTQDTIGSNHAAATDPIPLSDCLVILSRLSESVAQTCWFVYLWVHWTYMVKGIPKQVRTETTASTIHIAQAK